MTYASSILSPARTALEGRLHGPGDPVYADTCALFNTMIERRPRIVARVTSTADVVAALQLARDEGLDIAVRGGGHSVAGLSLVDDGLVIDTRGIDHVHVDPAARTARIGGGAIWAQVDAATQEHGLATTGGRVSTTGVAGFTLGGGSGWLERKHGLGCDNMIAAELVTADGEIVRCSADENSDLLWALRGGGGNFGVVTELTMQLHPVGPEVYGGAVMWPQSKAREVLEHYRELMRDAPDGLSLGFGGITAAVEAGAPEELAGQRVVVIAGMYAGPVEEGERLLAATRAFAEPAADLFGVVPYAGLQQAFDFPEGYRNWWTAEHVADLEPDAIDAIAARNAEFPVGPSEYFVIAWGGAVARHGAEHSPLAGRDAAFVVHPLLLWEDAADDERMIALGRATRDDMAPYAMGASYPNFIGDEGEERVVAAYGDSYTRIAEVKAKYDPRNAFRGNNQNMKPAAAG